MANVPVTGLSALGNVLAEFGDTYARNARQDQLIAQQRAQQLEDVNRAVALEETRYRRGREDTLKDVESSRAREDTVSARHRGEVLEDVGSNRMFAIALQDRDRAIKLADRAQFETDLKSLVNDSAVELKNVQGRINEALAEINKPEPVVNANDRAVQELAQQLAGGSRKKEDIALMVPKALEQIQLRAMMTHQQNVRSAHEALLSWKNTEIQLRQIIESGIQKNVAPSVTPPTSNPVTGSLMAPGQPMAAVTAADLAGEIAKARGARVATPPPGAALPPPPPPPNPLALAEQAGMFERPMLQQGRARVFAPETPEMYEAATQAIVTELGRVQALPPSRATVGRQAYLQDILQKLQPAMKAAPAGVNVLAPPVPNLNTSTSSTPLPSFAAPGSMAPSTAWWKSSVAP